MTSLERWPGRISMETLTVQRLSRLKAKSKVRTVLLKELLFADDAALISHTEEGLQHLIDRFDCTCKEFGLTISIKKTNVIGQNVPSISVNNEVLKVTDHFTYNVPWLYCDQQSVPRHRDRQANHQSYCCLVKTKQEGME